MGRRAWRSHGWRRAGCLSCCRSWRRCPQALSGQAPGNLRPPGGAEGRAPPWSRPPTRRGRAPRRRIRSSTASLARRRSPLPLRCKPSLRLGKPDLAQSPELYCRRRMLPCPPIRTVDSARRVRSQEFYPVTVRNRTIRAASHPPSRPSGLDHLVGNHAPRMHTCMTKIPP